MPDPASISITGRAYEDIGVEIAEVESSGVDLEHVFILVEKKKLTKLQGKGGGFRYAYQMPKATGKSISFLSGKKSASPPPTPSAKGTKNRKLAGLYTDIQQPGYLDFIGVNHTNLGSTIFMKLNGETGLKLD